MTLNSAKHLWPVVMLVVSVLPTLVWAQETGPADALWELYKQGRFDEVIAQGQALISTGSETAQVNLAVGRSLTDLERFGEGIPYLEKAARLDPQQTWVYAWAQNYLGICYHQLEDPQAAGMAWRRARDSRATRNATRTAVGNLRLLGLAENFDNWHEFRTEHFVFRFSDRLLDFDRVEFARRHEAAYTEISDWFGGGPAEPIQFFLWSDNEEANEAGMPPLGFARPRYFIIHAVHGQTVGHEMTHVITHHALQPTVYAALINEGTAVAFDQTDRDQLARARRALVDHNAGLERSEPLPVSVAAVWEDFDLLPQSVTYPLGGALVRTLIDRGGQARFLEFFPDQSLEHARQIYGNDLPDWLNELDRQLPGS